MLFKKEHYELLNHFETQFKHHRLDKEKKDMWHAGIIYQDGRVNEIFLAFRRGYAFGVYQSSDAAIELAATPVPSQPAVPQELCPTCGEDRPFSGTCGTSDSDTKALCKRKCKPPQPVTLTDGLIEKGAMTGMVDAQIDSIIAALREKDGK